MKNRTSLNIGLGIFLIICGFVGSSILAGMKTAPEKKESTEDSAAAVEVQILATASDSIKIKGFGTVKPGVSLDIPTELAGKIVYRNPKFEAGEMISAGEILFRIDAEPYRIKYDRAVAQVKQIETELTASAKEQAGLKQSLEISESIVELQEKELERYQHLEKAQATSKSQVDKVMGTFQSARSENVRAKNSLTQAQSARDTLLVTLGKAKTELREAELNLTKLEIKAPFAARVDVRNSECGEYVNPGSILGRIHDPVSYEVGVPLALHDILWLGDKASADNDVSGLLHVSDVTVAIKNSWIPSQRCFWKGTTERLSSQIDPQTRTFTVYVKINSEPEPQSSFQVPLTAGMFVEVEFTGRKPGDLFMVPRYVVSKDNTVSIYQNGVLSRRKVEIERIVDETAYIKGDIKTDELLILTTLTRNMEGARLKLASETGSKEISGEKRGS